MCSNNYMRHLSPDDPRSATKLKGADQGAMEARARMKQRSEAPNPASPMTERDWEKERRDWKAVEKVERRRNRGGQVFRRGDAFGE
jgi:hypothetical protein